MILITFFCYNKSLKRNVITSTYRKLFRRARVLFGTFRSSPKVFEKKCYKNISRTRNSAYCLFVCLFFYVFFSFFFAKSVQTTGENCKRIKSVNINNVFVVTYIVFYCNQLPHEEKQKTNASLVCSFYSSNIYRLDSHHCRHKFPSSRSGRPYDSGLGDRKRVWLMTVLLS